MFEQRENETRGLHLLRLAARAVSVACLAIILLFFLGGEIDLRAAGAKEWTAFVFFPFTVFIGLVLAWQEEGLGGVLAIAGVAGFYLIYGWLLSGNPNQGWALLPFLVPGVLFLVYGIADVIGRSQAVKAPANQPHASVLRKPRR